MLLLSLTLSCSGSGNDSAQDSADDGVFGDCDPVVLQPSLVAGGEGAPADPHSDTFGADPTPTHVRLHWPSSDPSRSAAMLWRTDLDTQASVVAFGTSADALDQRVEGYSFTFGSSDDARMHEVRLCGLLEPETTWYYRVGGDGHWSDTHSFTTPAAAGEGDSLRIGMVGDSRGGYDTWGTTLALIDAHEPDLILFSGDMVERGVEQEEWDAWFGAAEEIHARRVVVPTHGNHEFLAQAYFANWGLPGNEQWFHLALGPLDLISLNDTVNDFAYLESEQPDFLREVLGASDLPWSMVMHHQAMYSTNTRHGSFETLREHWEPAIDETGVDLVLAGHNHCYERSQPVRGGAVVGAAEGTTYVVTGGAGAPLYTDFEEDWFGEVAAAVEHYVIADLGPTDGAFTAYDLSGTVVDSFVVPAD